MMKNNRMKRVYSFAIVLSICVTFLPLSAVGETDFNFSDEKSTESVEYNAKEINPIPPQLIPPNKASTTESLLPDNIKSLSGMDVTTIQPRATTTVFSETFEGAWPGSWTVGDSDTGSGSDYWGDNSYRAYAGSWSGWCADIGSKTSTETVTEVVYTQNFDNGGAIPSGWTAYSGGPNNHPWEMVLDSGTDYHAECNSDAAGSGTNITEWLYMTTESINCSVYTSLTLGFYLDYNYYNGGEFAQVLYAKSADYPTFTILKEWNSADVTGTQSIDLSAAAGDSGVHLGFRYHGTYDYWMKVDDVYLNGTKTVETDTPNTDTHTYDNYMYAYMYRSVSLSSYDSATLTFYLWLDSESGYDYFKVIYYNGVSWLDLYSKDGNTAGWISVSVDVPTNATYVGFLFDSDTSVYSYEGAYVDNVVLTGTSNTPPTASFTYLPSNPTTSDTISFTDTSTDSDGTIASWSWNFGDGGTSTLQNPTHQYTTAATYTVTLTVTDNGGATDSTSQNIVVTETPNSPPTASFTYSPTSPTTDSTISFTDTSTDSDGTIASWSWDFGDGTTSTLQNPTHQYTMGAIYTVTLTVTDNDGATNSTSKSINVGWGTIGPSGLVYVLVDSSVYTSLQNNLTTYKSDLENEGYSVGVYSDSWATISDVRTVLQDGFSYGLVGAVLVGNLPIAWYYLVNPASWGVDPETFPTELYYMDLNGTWGPGSGTQAAPFTDHTGHVVPEIWVGRLYASTAGGTEVTLLQNYFSKNHNYRLGNLELPGRALVYVDDDWFSYADQWDADVGLLYTNRTLVKDQETTTATDYKNRLTLEYEWISLFSHSDSWYHAMKYNSGASWSYVYNTDITTIDPRASFYNLYCCYAANYSDGTDNGYLGGRYVFSNTYGLMAVGSTKTGSMLNFDDFYSPLGNGKTIGNAFKDWYTLNGETGQGADSRAWFYGMTILGDPTLKPNSTTSDSTPPTGSISINSGETYTTTTSVTLTLNAVDAESGVSQMCFSNDGTTWTAWETYATSKSWTLTTGDGSKTVYVKYKNGADLVSSAYSDSIILDTAAPTGSIVINGGDVYTTSTSVTLTLTYSDATSGVSQVRYSNDGVWDTELWESSSATKSWTLTSGDGTKTVYYQIKDNAGLISSAYSDTIILDTAAPTGSIVINSGDSYTIFTSVTLTLSASDTNGVAQMCFSNNGTTYTTWEAYTTSKSWTLPKGDGTKTVYVKYKDNAGLISSAYSDTIILDTVEPTSSVSALPKFETTTNFTVSWSGTDATSGIGSYDVQYKNGSTGVWTDWQSGVTSTSASFTGADGYTYYFQCRATDNAGNAEAYPGGDGDTSTTIDATAPSSSVSALPKFETTTSFTVSWSGTDSASDIANYDVQYKDGSTGTWTNWQTGVTTTSATFTGTDGHTYYFQCRATDNAGNVEAYLGGDGDTSTTIDATAPSIASTTPSDGGVNVSLTQNIIIQFSEEMDTGSVIYTCSPNPGGWISSWNATKDTLTLTHNDFSPGITYTFNVTAAKDLAGHDLVSGLVSNPWIFTTAKITEFNFSPGWNSFALPFINGTIDNAESLANAIGENCTAISCWNNSLGRFITHPVGTEISNFNIEPGVGYMAFVSDKTIFTFTGESKIDSATMTLDVGWNSVGRFNETTTTAESIGDSISNCTHVARWNETSQSFDVYAVGSGVNNFNIEQGDGYLVYVTKESEWVNE